jgi:hypothetical protein
VSLAIATVYFASWLGLELLVFVAYGTFGQAARDKSWRWPTMLPIPVRVYGFYLWLPRRVYSLLQDKSSRPLCLGYGSSPPQYQFLQRQPHLNPIANRYG